MKVLLSFTNLLLILNLFSSEALHPLDPLTQQEIEATTLTIESYKKSKTLYIYQTITLEEPPKSSLLPSFLNDSPPPTNNIPRKSFSVITEKFTGNVFQVVVDLSHQKVESFIHIKNIRAPSPNPSGHKSDLEIIRSHPGVQRRCAAAGYPNMSLVVGEGWGMAYYEDILQYKGKNLRNFYLFGKNYPHDNKYAHPLDFMPIFDVDKQRIIAIEELPTHDGFDPNNKLGNVVPKAEANYHHELRGKNFLRKDVKPIKISMPEGPSYKVDGNQIQWQKWKMRLGFNKREGLVLYTISYNDTGKIRPLIYRSSIAEMYVPYGDPRPPFHRRAVFDLGEIGVGATAVSQTPNEDVLGPAHFFSYFLNDLKGQAEFRLNVVSVREEDAGILWKHVDYRTGKGVVTRSHRLVISFIATLGNYDYIFLYQFYQDGSIQILLELTGCVSLTLMALKSTPGGYGSPVAKQINAQYHQHLFNARLDMDIDSVFNSVQILDILPQETSLYGQGIVVNKTLLKTVAQARTNISPLTGRTWLVTNPSSSSSYKLIPQANPQLLMKQDSPLRFKAKFLDYSVWVTPYNDDQIYPGGQYLNKSGLPEWVGKDLGASIENKDVVLWYNFGLVHIPRTEDWPVMPQEFAGFWLKPFNFFKENPSIDVPPAENNSGNKLKGGFL